MVRTKEDTSGSKLSELPVELLEPITGHLHYLDVANLYFIGTKSLNVKLANGGVSQLDVRFWSDHKPLVWPSLFSQLCRLKRFKLINWKTSPNPLVTSDMLALLPKTLKELHVESNGGFFALQRLLRQNPDYFPALEKLRVHTAWNDTFDEGIAPLWPRVSDLTVNQRVPTPLPLHLSSLPTTTLTRLSGNFLSIHSDGCAFPASLTSIEIRLQHLSCDPVPLLPSGLKTLSLDVGDVEEHFESWNQEDQEFETWANRAVASLPRSIVNLRWPVEWYTAEAVQALPPKLESLLDGRMDAEECARFLPSTLTFCFGCSDHSSSVEKDLLQYIPKGLTQLGVTMSALPHVKLNHVSVVVAESEESFKDEMLALNMSRLDSCITSITCQCSHDEDLLRALPLNLTSLWLSNAPITAEQFKMLPKTLTKLALREGILPECEDGPKLKDLTLFTDELPTYLPPTLLNLHVSIGQNFPLTWFQGLPRGLKSLSCPLYWTSLPSALTTSPPCLELPPSLTRIIFSLGKPTEEASGQISNIIVSLPPSLESFRLSIYGQFPCKPIESSLFPKRLIELELPNAVRLVE